MGSRILVSSGVELQITSCKFLETVRRDTMITCKIGSSQKSLIFTDSI